MAKIKTPIIKAFREKGGTFCSFNSAIEDIGLNINEKQNKVRLSHYAILNIPTCDYQNDSSNNVFNLLSTPSSFFQNINQKDEDLTPNTNIAQSFMSYALNMEATIRNDKNTYYSYNFLNNLSVSERVFWKWLKETGAIRWQRAYKFSNGEITNELDYTYYTEENSNNYNRVVKSFGEIDAVSQRSSDYGMYNEIYVNIPTSFGEMQYIFFKQISDDNYSFDRKYSANTTNFYNLEGHDDILNDKFNSGLKNIGFFDYTSDIINGKDGYTFYLNDEEGFWYGDFVELPEYTAYYITDKKIENDTSILNDKITIKNSNDETCFSIIRSKLDCMLLEMDCNNIANILGKNNITYDELNINNGENSIKDYQFNTILVYYSIYDDNDNILATNLYGIFFLDSPQELMSENDKINNKAFINFEIPSLTKKQSTKEGFGTSYSFRLNIRTSSIYDDSDSEINDNSSSENSIVNDFNDVISKLNISIDLLSKNTKNTEILKNKYDEIQNNMLSIINRITKIEENLNNIKNKDNEILLLNEKIDNVSNELKEFENKNITYFDTEI